MNKLLNKVTRPLQLKEVLFNNLGSEHEIFTGVKPEPPNEDGEGVGVAGEGEVKEGQDGVGDGDEAKQNEKGSQKTITVIDTEKNDDSIKIQDGDAPGDGV